MQWNVSVNFLFGCQEAVSKRNYKKRKNQDLVDEAFLRPG